MFAHVFELECGSVLHLPCFHLDTIRELDNLYKRQIDFSTAERQTLGLEFKNLFPNSSSFQTSSLIWAMIQHEEQEKKRKFKLLVKPLLGYYLLI